MFIKCISLGDYILITITALGRCYLLNVVMSYRIGAEFHRGIIDVLIEFEEGVLLNSQVCAVRQSDKSSRYS